MVIAVSKDCQIVAEDGLNYTLQRRRVRGEDAANPGEVVWSNEGYYPNLLQAGEAAVRKGLAATEGRVTMPTLLRALRAAYARLETVCAEAVSASTAAELEGVVAAEPVPAELFDL